LLISGRVRRLICGVCVAVAACDGQILTRTPAAPEPVRIRTEPSNGWPSFAPVESLELRRLTREQYLATVRTLLQLDPAGVPAIEPVSPVAGFETIGAASAVVSTAGVGQFEGAANFLARAALATSASRQRLVPCDPAQAGCFRTFVEGFGAKAFRRPLDADEADRYTALATLVAGNTSDPWAAIESTLSAFLQSPNFLYLSEAGEPDPASPGRWRFTAHEMAARLSYFFTDDMPDDELMAAAASGALLTADGVRAQGERLLATPKARSGLRTFFTGLLALEGLDTFFRPVQAFPQFTPTLPAALKEETLRTLEDLVLDRDGDYRDAFDQRFTYVNAETARFYSVAEPPSGFARVSLPADGPRAGLLGQAGVLAVHDHNDGTSPTKRGLFVLTRLLCQNLALAPPSGLDIPPPPSGLLTQRERLERHVKDPACAGCHVQMDSVGLSLEHFDALGAWRDTDHGLPIDDRGELNSEAYQGGAGLGALVKKHIALGPCLVQSLYGSSVGHLVTEHDRESFSQAVAAYDSSGARLKAVLTAITISDGFRFRPPP
jgi:hypothetical protein